MEVNFPSLMSYGSMCNGHINSVIFERRGLIFVFLLKLSLLTSVNFAGQ